MPPSNSAEFKPPSPPRLRSTNLPEDSDRQAVNPEPFLSGHPILLEDMDLTDLTPEQIHEMNQKLLEESMDSDRPLVSPPDTISVLQDEYANSPNFLAQIGALITRGYNTIVRVKGDGDCFYRALAFAYLDRVIKSREHNTGNKLAESDKMLANAGFDCSVYEQPYKILQSLAQLRSASHPNASDELWLSLIDAETSNYIVLYMRLLTSAQLRFDQQLAEFLFDPDFGTPLPVEDFCRRFVEPLGKEAGGSAGTSLNHDVEKKRDHVQVAALAQALNVQVKVAYLDGHGAEVTFVDFPENAPRGAEPLVLLYRPGHYDILQKAA